MYQIGYYISTVLPLLLSLLGLNSYYPFLSFCMQGGPKFFLAAPEEDDPNGLPVPPPPADDTRPASGSRLPHSNK